VALGVLVCVLGSGIVAAGARGGPAANAAGLGAKPNIVVVTTDDQRADELNAATMPTVVNRIGNRGATFKNSFVTSPLCCPSRATFLTGQYGHNNGILANFPGFPALVDGKNILPAWLQRAGYRTALVGKYLHGYVNTQAKHPAPGWDKWFAMLRPFRYFRLRLGVNGKVTRFPNRARDYLTSVLSRYAVRFVRRNAPRKRPFFLWYTPWAPHEAHPGTRNTKRGARSSRCDGTAIPAPRDDAAFLEQSLPNPPSFDESDVSDKPSFIRASLHFNQPGAHTVRDIVQRYRCRLASLPAVDRGIGRILDALAKADELDNTVIVVTSDNGFFLGEHRLALGKNLPYEEAIRVPLVMRLPPSLGQVPPGSTIHEPVANIDLAPTLLELAGAKPCISSLQCRVMDGRSLMPLLHGETSAWPPDRGILIELRQGIVCRYEAIRTPRYVYAEYVEEIKPGTGTCEPTDERELYDLQADPFELNNLEPPGGPTPAAVESELEQRLEELRPCSGIEGRDPQPPRGRFCE
jgi:N-acetylglucosamine-6-sulfatase